jgi:hypothetical protein
MLIIVPYCPRQKMVLQPFQTVGYSLVSLLALEEIIIVPPSGFPTQIPHLGSQFPKSVYEIRESQNDDGTGRDYAGDDCWFSH